MPGVATQGQVRAALWRVGLALLGVGAGLLLAEVVLRFAQPVPVELMLPIPYHERRFKRLVVGDTYVRFDAGLGWVTTPDITRRAGNVTYHNNRAGLRSDREYEPQPAPGLRRLAAFGDSFTYCHEVDLADCWTTQLEQAWPNTEVLNFGVPGYGPDQAWLRYQRDGARLQTCGVLIGYMIENINRVVNRFRPFLVPETDLIASKPRFLLEGDGLTLMPNPATDPRQLEDPGWVERVVGQNDRWYFPGMLVANPLDGFQLVRLARTAAYREQHGDPDVDGMAWAYRERGEAFEITGRVLIDFARQVRRDGGSPVVLVFSPAAGIEAALRGEAPEYAPLLDWLRREGVQTIDLTDELVQEARRSGVSSVARFHYTPQGNAVIAAALARRLPELVGKTCGM